MCIYKCETLSLSRTPKCYTLLGYVFYTLFLYSLAPETYELVIVIFPNKKQICRRKNKFRRSILHCTENGVEIKVRPSVAQSLLPPGGVTCGETCCSPSSGVRPSRDGNA